MTEERSSPKFLPMTTLYKVVNDCKQYGIKSVVFSGGGEPLMHAGTVGTAYELRKVGTSVSLNTNGLLLPEDTTYCFDHVRVSVDAGTRETYNTVHGRDAFDAVTEKLKVAKTNELGLAFLVTPHNYKEIPEFLEWAQQIPYTFVHIRPAWYSDDRMREPMQYLYDMNMGAWAEKTFRDVFFRVDKFDGVWTPRLYSKCRASALKAILCADGRFAVCQDNFIKFGDYNNKTFLECWFSKEHQDALDAINIEECPRCVECGYNEIIENCVMNDGLYRGLI